jgi:signal transduction histidine kinase
MSKRDESQAADLTRAGMAHDLNNVFQALVGIAVQLEEHPGLAALSTAILRSVERGQHIVASLHGCAAEPALLGQILCNARTFLKDHLAASHGPAIELTQAVDSGIELSDPWAWERVFVNLFLNSAHAMPGGGTIHVEARLQTGVTEITVTDEGSGIATNMLDHLFEPHRSAHGSTGLGLNIVESIVHANGGHVRASNRTGGRGATFSITLPTRIAAVSAGK